MNNTIILMFTLMNILSDLIEFTFTLGQLTRKHLLPVMIYIGVGIYHYGLKTYDNITSQEFQLNVKSTPFTTGFSHT